MASSRRPVTRITGYFKFGLIKDMLRPVSTYFSRVDKFAAACYGRGKAAISLGAWFTVDGVLGGDLKKLLKGLGLGWLPAATNFIVFLAYFLSQAKITHDIHPDSIDLIKEGKKFKATTEMILGQFNKYSTEAEIYLQNFRSSDFSLIEKSLHSEEINGTMKHYDLLHKLYNELKPHRVSTCHQLGDGMVHGLSYFYEYLLLIYFEEVNILNALLSFEGFSLASMLGILVLIGSLGSAFQSYSFAAKPKVALDEELLKEISDNFLNFRESYSQEYGSQGYGSLSIYARKIPDEMQELEPDIPMGQEYELIKHYAAGSSSRRCYLHG